MSCMSLQTHPQQNSWIQNYPNFNRWIPCGIPPLSGKHHRGDGQDTVRRKVHGDPPNPRVLHLGIKLSNELIGRWTSAREPVMSVSVWCISWYPNSFLAKCLMCPRWMNSRSSFFSMNITNFGTSDTEDCKCVTVRFDSLIHCMDKSWTNVHDCDVFDCNQKLVPRFFFVDFCWLNLLRNCPRKCHSIPYYQQSV